MILPKALLLLQEPKEIHLEEQFLEIIEKNQGIVHKVCAMYVDKQEDRQDLFQEILIQLWKAYPRFRGDSKISTWMYRVALNTAISHFRKETRKPAKTSLDMTSFQVADTPYDYEYEEKLKILKNAIQYLSKIERAIMMLYLEDKDYEEIAQTVGITQNYVRVKMNRIRNKLKKILTKQ